MVALLMYFYSKASRLCCSHRPLQFCSENLGYHFLPIVCKLNLTSLPLLMFSCFIAQLSSYICLPASLCKAFFLLAALSLAHYYLLEVSAFKFTSNKTCGRTKDAEIFQEDSNPHLVSEAP